MKVLDFGIAKMIDADDPNPMNVVETQAGTVFGTPRYMSPEQAQGKPLDARSDLYSLAVILYQMLTGRPPFTDNDAVVVMARHIKSTPKRPNEAVPEAMIPTELEDVIMRTLAKEPKDRPGERRDLRRRAARRARGAGRADERRARVDHERRRHPGPRVDAAAADGAAEAAAQPRLPAASLLAVPLVVARGGGRRVPRHVATGAATPQPLAPRRRRDATATADGGTARPTVPAATTAEPPRSRRTRYRWRPGTTTPTGQRQARTRPPPAAPKPAQGQSDRRPRGRDGTGTHTVALLDDAATASSSRRQAD